VDSNAQQYIVGCRPITGNDLETNNKTTFAAGQQILNEQVYAAVTV
jgi:hypothetical protein